MKPLTDKHLAILRRHMVEMVDLHYDLAEDETGRSAPAPELRRALRWGSAFRWPTVLR